MVSTSFPRARLVRAFPGARVNITAAVSAVQAIPAVAMSSAVSDDQHPSRLHAQVRREEYERDRDQAQRRLASPAVGV